MLEEMSAKTWGGWQVWRRDGLLPSERVELMLAQLCMLTVEVNRWGKKKGRRLKPTDFTLKTWPGRFDPPEQTPEGQRQMLQGLAQFLQTNKDSIRFDGGA